MGERRDFGRLAQRPLYALALAALVVWCLAATRDYAVPIAISVLIWFLINALADAMRTLPVIGPVIPSIFAKAISVLTLFVAIILTTNLLVDGVTVLTRELTEGRNGLFAGFENWAAELGLANVLRPEDLIERLDFERYLGGVLGYARGLVSNVSLIFLYVLFLLVDEPFYDAKLRALVPDKDRRDALERTLRRIGGETQVYLALMSLVSAGVALLTYGFCVYFGVDGAGFWGFLAFALNFIPTIGSILAVALPGLYAVLTLSDPASLALLVIALSVTQFVAGQVFVPRLMGDTMNLSTFVILLSLVVWGAIWGPAGMFLAVPITVIMVLICAQFPATRPIAILLSRDGRVPEAGDDT